MKYPKVLSVCFCSRIFEGHRMPSETTVLLRSIRRWLLAATFLLGVTLSTIARAGYVISGYNEELLFNLATVVGMTIAVGAAFSWLVGTPSENGDEAT
ncbi:hypothetical protein [Halonotius roseus]|uniref:Uncharacterized protein n=1 Tax=Halonotius roseus TaxID=2511997 RepID=A0A544QP48_9EURY|nr:hypothetical protein [Halonotius roseus]TQQ80645.1 hypothetical protein EWF95_09195 [Halonotius roseus]